MRRQTARIERLGRHGRVRRLEPWLPVPCRAVPAGWRLALLPRTGEVAAGSKAALAGVDPSVMGGVVARVGDTVIDGTVRRHLEQLKAQI